MKLTATRAALLKQLGNITRIVEKRNTIPILSNVKLTAEGARLGIEGTDLDRTAIGDCAAQIATPGTLTAPAAMLHDIVRKLPEGEISLEASDATLTVKAGRSRFQLQILPSEDYPDLAIGPMSHRFEIAGPALLRLIDDAQFAISTEETRFYLNGIYLHTVDAERTLLRAVATDGHRLARIEMEAPEGAQGMPGVIVPRKTVAEVVRLLKDHADEEHGRVTVELSPQKIRFSIAGIVLISKLIDGTFPDYQRVIPQANDKRLTVETPALVAAVDRVSTVSGESRRALRMAIDEGRITLTVRDPDHGEATEEVEADYDGPSVEIGFNARYLAEILSHAGGDTVLIKIDNAGAPAVFTSREGAPALFVLMPMRV
ncbi:DNA polymerase-3 subunit beta [Microvirga flocculans]|uniref:Beta sliding clamp n=1 Tax=Microvirga flocculans TaxID=217168 RepID=A0A7W6N9U3_9HYPH|nr:DNA polymerase III subunit beta [Microvirga flocculans]MBB4042046.1 DNA polymerase-3 subunit beta [Microvirga flocculans]